MLGFKPKLVWLQSLGSTPPALSQASRARLASWQLSPWPEEAWKKMAGKWGCIEPHSAQESIWRQEQKRPCQQPGQGGRGAHRADLGLFAQNPAELHLPRFVPRTWRAQQCIWSFSLNRSVCFCYSWTAWKVQCVQPSEIPELNSDSASFSGLTHGRSCLPRPRDHPGTGCVFSKPCASIPRTNKDHLFSLFSFLSFFPFSPFYFPSLFLSACHPWGREMSSQNGIVFI